LTFHAEAHISTQPPPPFQDARVSHPYEDEERSGRSFAPPRQGTQARLRKCRIPRLVSCRPPNDETRQVSLSAAMTLRENAVSGGVSEKFPRTARLLKRADFRQVYEQGRRHFSANFTAFYRANAVGHGARIGFTVSRALGGAVDRNRMKRRLREASRACWEGFHPTVAVDVVVNPKKTVLTADFAVLTAEMRKTLAVVEKAANSGQANPRPAQDVVRERSKPRAGKAQR
jgi:ribonuclease P protein component